MKSIEEVDIQGISIERMAPLILPERVERLQALAEDARGRLGGSRIINVNSTAAGGGVAEMMQVLLAYARGADIDVRWLVISGTEDFFAITKRIHNMLHGSPGDGGALGETERASYEQVLRENASELRDLIRPDDIVILHDPQTAGLLEAVRNIGATVLWRCHVGTDHPNSITHQAWEFLRPYLNSAYAFIFTRDQYAPEWIDRTKTFIIQPSIDPFSPKNIDISSAECESILLSTGILANDGDHAVPDFQRSDGSKGTVTRKAEIIRSGAAPSVRDKIVAQVSRWDRLKDMLGVMEGFANYVDPSENAHLLLVGPAVSGVSDDPEGEDVFNECRSVWGKLPDEIRSRIHLVLLPMEDRDENAIMVNAIQRHAAIVVQKSVAEGFGLTVTEAMWKGRAVVASEIGGIPDQITDGEHGVLIHDPSNLKEFGDAINELLRNDEYARQLGQNARARVIREFLADRHLENYARLIQQIRG